MQSRSKLWPVLALPVVALALLATAAPAASAQEYVYISNFADGTVSGFSIDPAGGSLTEVAGSPFAAGVGAVPITHGRDGHLLFVALLEQYLGDPCGTNVAQLISYRIQRPTGRLTQVEDISLPDYCPSDVIVDPTGKFVYVAAINFGDNKFGEIPAYRTTPGGALTVLPGSPFPSPIDVSPGQGPAIQSLAITLDGTVLYASDPNDGAGILIFDRDLDSGALVFRTTFDSGTPLGAMRIDPSGKFLLALPPDGAGTYEYSIGVHGDLTSVVGSPFASPNASLTNALAFSPFGNFVAIAQTGGVIVESDIPSTGQLSLVPDSPFGCCLPFAVAFAPSGHFVYTPGTIFQIDPQTGALTQISTFQTGSYPLGMTAVRPCPLPDRNSDDGGKSFDESRGANSNENKNENSNNNYDCPK